MLDDKTHVLEFDGVTVAGARHWSGSVSGMSLDVPEAELVLIRLNEGYESYPLFNTAEGLLKPEQGIVRFLGRDWEELSPFEQCSCRGRIGRVFESRGWVSNLTLYENISLAQKHHTGRSESEVHAEIDILAAPVGLSGLMGLRPDMVRNAELRKAQWIRAFIGNPALILLERPELNVENDMLQQLFNFVDVALRERTSIVWTTSDDRVWKNARLKFGGKYIINVGGFKPAEND